MDKYFRCFGLPGALPLTALLSLLALALAIAFPTSARWLCFAAMLFSSAGDVLLMHLPAIEKNVPRHFEIGAGLFMIAHVLYALCFARLIRDSGAKVINPGFLFMLAVAVCLAAWMVRLSAASGRTGQLPLILIYVAMIALDCTLVFSYAWSQGMGNPWAIVAAVGAASFLISDLFIGLNMVTGTSRFGHLIWWYYPIGQVLMILGVGRG